MKNVKFYLFFPVSFPPSLSPVLSFSSFFRFACSSLFWFGFVLLLVRICVVVVRICASCCCCY
ncbi:hypothetical protein MtrunA17_Chr2g0280651 [Medicago truncatula]|uniref:Transmembrane protein n=1 Tax=Medicago truncatula TaxID=3880 RepID=A0A396J5A1_MEDTR|nr:hypothetical protein MtrunA17_Chr2g0280651 [Medicago truncatula]